MNFISDESLKKIVNDKISGSTELLGLINLYFRKNFRDRQKSKDAIKYLAHHLGTFPNIQNYLHDLSPLLGTTKLTEKYFKNFDLKSEKLFDNIFNNALPCLTDKKFILTISNSRTVFEIIKRLSKIQNLYIIVCESRPKFEGRQTAKNLARENINVRLITEAMASGYLVNCDCVLTGADQILKNNNAVNKVGSLELAVLAHYFGKPFYIAADPSKYTGRIRFTQRKESSDQIWKNPPKDILIENKYFEEIPNKLITRIITNKKARQKNK
ncbi:MAG: hypothetical protein CVV24_14545 [Ignavibacteriae bacterium HGW-Ignavibacteriae-3]|nr:MAG: hypothetical protein CVV24_14545 [Ignavibacteriae bacterium HGW-Ignavibacteriae-3]